MRGALVVAAALAIAAAEPAPPNASTAAEAAPRKATGATGAAAEQLERLKALAGTWTGKAAHGKGAPSDVNVEWRLTAGGTAVTETLFAGTPHEMMTVYHLDGPDLLATHYCALGNAPTLRAVPSEPGTLALELVRGANMKPSDPHMHAARITFVDADHLKTEWTSWAGGKPGDVARFEVRREKK